MRRRVSWLGFAWMLTACGGPSTLPVATDPLGNPIAKTPATKPVEPPRPPPVDPQSTPEGARDYAIALLEHQEYRELIAKLASPDDVERIAKEEGGLDKLIEGFANSEKPTALLEILRSTVGREPELLDDGNRARFEAVDHGSGRKLSFRRIDGKWYIEN